jgi:hypothetical protein
MWLLWTQYSDRSGDPEFLGLFPSEQEAHCIAELLSPASSPDKDLRITKVPKHRFLGDVDLA